jgi:hypothetical protein
VILPHILENPNTGPLVILKLTLEDFILDFKNTHSMFSHIHHLSYVLLLVVIDHLCYTVDLILPKVPHEIVAQTRPQLSKSYFLAVTWIYHPEKYVPIGEYSLSYAIYHPHQTSRNFNF